MQKMECQISKQIITPLDKKPVYKDIQKVIPCYSRLIIARSSKDCFSTVPICNPCPDTFLFQKSLLTPLLQNEIELLP